MKFWTIIIVFIVGVLLGFGLQGLVPASVSSYLPQSLQVQDEVVEGIVVRKSREQDRLLLTVSTPQGALLATFKNQISEIDLLVEKNDRLTLGLVRYEPFVHDPMVKGVMKPDRLPQTLVPSPTPSGTSPDLPGSPELHSVPLTSSSETDVSESQIR